MVFRIFVITSLVFLAGSCASVPQSSVTLSNSIAEDMLSMQKAHKEFVVYYYDGLEQQANNLIDEKYRPSLIRQVIEQDVSVFKNPVQKNNSLFNAIQEAFIDNGALNKSDLATAQSNAMAGMKIFYTKIDRKVESERNNLLNPLRQQRQKLLANIDANYTNIIKKNSAVTALLNSVVDVHEAQQQLYSMAGGKGNPRDEVGNKVANLSDEIQRIQGSVDDKNSKVENVEAAIMKFKTIISE